MTELHAIHVELEQVKKDKVSLKEENKLGQALIARLHPTLKNAIRRTSLGATQALVAVS